MEKPKTMLEALERVHNDATVLMQLVYRELGIKRLVEIIQRHIDLLIKK